METVLQVILTGILSFVSSDLDDIIVLTLLFTQRRKYRTGHIIAGQLLGIGSLVLISLLINYGLGLVATSILKWIGILPIILGVKYWYDYYYQSKSDNENMPETVVAQHSMIGNVLGICLLTISNGADNIGIYVPLFTQYSNWELGVIIAVYGAMTLVWCYFGYRLASLPALQVRIERYRRWLIPLIFVLLGIYVLFKNGAFN